jgi:transcriptional repressor NrdR
MRCPYCGVDDDRVIDSRASEGGRVVRRRRQCGGCAKRFTTYERIEEAVRLTVIKRDGTRVPFGRSRIVSGLQRACWKRPVTTEALEKLADQVEEEIFRRFDREVSSRFIGERVAQKLRAVDQIAYVRFASVYNQFKDVGQFIDQAREVLESKRKQPDPQQPGLFDGPVGEPKDGGDPPTSADN